MLLDEFKQKIETTEKSKKIREEVIEKAKKLLLDTRVFRSTFKQETVYRPNFSFKIYSNPNEAVINVMYTRSAEGDNDCEPIEILLIQENRLKDTIEINNDQLSSLTPVRLAELLRILGE